MKKIPASRLNELLLAISGEQDVYVPQELNNTVSFAKWEDGKTARLDVLKTNRSPKDLFFPQVEDIARFKLEGKKIKVIEGVPEDKRFVLFGVRACDARSFHILDTVFLSEPIDPNYKRRRENGTVVSLACSRPSETCFCASFGIDAGDPEGDVSAWLSGDDLYWRANTEKGNELTNLVSNLLEDCDEAAVNEEKEKLKKIFSLLPLSNLDLSSFTPDRMMEIFNSKSWEPLSRSCVGCGTCTFVCPTCQCYDIRDFDCGGEICRFRCWDSCMYSDFTKMASGNPRKTQVERFRQRFMHKLVYHPANHDGEYSCVGCGRCLEKCPVSMNIAKVARVLGEEAK